MIISALIPAAGIGRRIGTPKLMLEIEGRSFLEIIVKNIFGAGIKNVICVVSEETYDWAQANVPGIKYVINLSPERGMLSSIFCGIKKVGKCDSVLLIPVDHPYVRQDTYKILNDTAEKNIGSIIKPRFKGKSGHPIILPADLLDKDDEKFFSLRLDGILRKSKYRKIYVDVKDDGILKNVNTRDDYDK